MSHVALETNERQNSFLIVLFTNYEEEEGLVKVRDLTYPEHNLPGPYIVPEYIILPHHYVLMICFGDLVSVNFILS